MNSTRNHPNRFHRLIAAVATIVMATGCTSTQTLHDPQQNLESQLRPGDTIVVRQSDRVIEMKYVELRDGQLVGEQGDTVEPTSVPLEDIEEIRVEKLDGGKTFRNIGKTAGTALAGAVYGAAWLMGAFDY